MTYSDLQDPLRSALWWGLFNFDQAHNRLTVEQAFEIIDRQVQKIQETIGGPHA